jgi:putative MATE family efflux protein
VGGFGVAGLGAAAVAEVGLFFPFFLFTVALGAGLGVGGSSAVSRRIGMRDKKGADNTAIHTILLGVVVALVLSLPVLPFLERIFHSFSGSESVGSLAAEYAEILFGGTVILVFSHIAGALLRGEGDARRAMKGMIAGSFLNIILDPIFIYVLDMGVRGAAVATVISMTVSTLLFCYWLFLKGDTFLKITLRDFTFSRTILREILGVGLPSSLAQLSMSLAMVVINRIVIMAGGTDGVAVFTSGWRIVMVGVIPLIGISTGVVAVTGAAFGAGNREKLKAAFYYSVKMALIVEVVVGILTYIFAGQLALIFAYSEGSERILGDLITFLRIICLFYPAVPFGMLTSAMFRGVGEGNRSLVVTIIRTILFQVPVVYLFGIVMDMGLTGVWIGIVAGNVAATVITFSWGVLTVNRLPLPAASDNSAEFILQDQSD